MGAHRSGRKAIGPVITLTVEREVIDALDATAAVVGISRGQLIRSLLRDGLKRINSNNN